LGASGESCEYQDRKQDVGEETLFSDLH
jgi:hypothetical protein